MRECRAPTRRPCRAESNVDRRAPVRTAVGPDGGQPTFRVHGATSHAPSPIDATSRAEASERDAGRAPSGSRAHESRRPCADVAPALTPGRALPSRGGALRPRPDRAQRRGGRRALAGARRRLRGAGRGQRGGRGGRRGRRARPRPRGRVGRRRRAAGSATRATAGASWPSAPASRSPPASRRCSPTWARSSTSGRAARRGCSSTTVPSRSWPPSTATPSARCARCPGSGRRGSARRCARGRTRARCARCGCFLEEHGVPAAVAARIYRAYGPGAIETLRSDPYGLTELDGIGFATADALAQALGTPPDSPGRLDAGLRHALRRGRERRPLPSPPGRSGRARPPPARRRRRRPHRRARRPRQAGGRGRPRLRSRDARHRDARLARHVRALIDDEPRLRLGAIERPTGPLRPDRRPVGGRARGARSPARDPHRRPGTGKTMTMRALVDLLHAERAHGAPLRAHRQGGAPAGRDRPGAQATTIHRLLEYSPGEGFARDADDPIPGTDVLIVDEASMLSVRLAEALFARRRPAHARAARRRRRPARAGRPRPRARRPHRVRPRARRAR